MAIPKVNPMANPDPESLLLIFPSVSLYKQPATESPARNVIYLILYQIRNDLDAKKVALYLLFSEKADLISSGLRQHLFDML